MRPTGHPFLRDLRALLARRDLLALPPTVRVHRSGRRNVLAVLKRSPLPLLIRYFKLNVSMHRWHTAILREPLSVPPTALIGLTVETANGGEHPPFRKSSMPLE